MAIAGLVAVSTRLWLVRHGATDWSDAGRLTGWTDVPLNEEGRLQARILRTTLRGRGFAGIWSSDLQRAIQTARVAVGGAIADKRLRELNFGELEGRTWNECPHEIQEGLLAFDSFSAPGGESVGVLRERVLDFLAQLPPGDHLVFTHGGVVRLLLREVGHDARVAPGGLIVVAWPDEGRMGTSKGTTTVFRSGEGPKAPQILAAGSRNPC
jgi:2,3-bisphosphoglycerate-dependent phosphoglycerate mutase